MSAENILDQLQVLSDPTRCRLLRVLEAQELTVGELCTVLGLPQSTVSRHLKHLADRGWTTVRREGSRRFYRLREEPLSRRDRRLWTILRQELDDLDGVRQDRTRLQQVLADRRVRSSSFFRAAAGDWDRLRAELFGERFDLYGLLGLLDPTWVVGDLGCGTGALCETLAPFVRRVVAVDASSEMLGAAAERLDGLDNIDLRSGDLEELPIEDATLDAAILFLVLQYTADPTRVLEEAHRALRPGAPLLVVDVARHEDEAFRERTGQMWQGFDREPLVQRLAGIGFGQARWTPIPGTGTGTGSGTGGPSLFTLTVRRRTGSAQLAPREAIETGS